MKGLLTRRAGLLSLSPVLLFFVVTYSLGAQGVAPTPPMGWNSWDSYGLTVTEAEFQQNASVLAERLRSHGWQYATVDEGWYLKNPEAKPGSFAFTLDANGRFLPAVNRFGSAASGDGFSKLAAWTHGHNLKFGIHIIRGIPREAVEKNLPIAGSKFHARDAASRSDTCGWNADNFGVSANAAGQAYYDSIAALYAGWGVDLVKIDCISSPYLENEIRMFSSALRKTGRPIVLSLSPGPTPIEKASEVRAQANMWRISGDIWDQWKQVAKEDWVQGLLAQFPIAAQWAPHAEADHWPDADMLPLGYLGPRPGWRKARASDLSAAESRTLMTLWAMMRSPLIMGGNLTRLDKSTEALLTNEEVLNVDQRATGGRQVSNSSGKIVWVSRSSPGKRAYVALFNVADNSQTVEYPLQSLGLSAVSFAVRDLWARKDLGMRDRLSVELPAHASALFAVQP